MSGRPPGSSTETRHQKRAQALAASAPEQAREAYMAAWRYYGFGALAYPGTHPKNVRAHALATAAFKSLCRPGKPDHRGGSRPV
jgi:hypothetical protein